MLKNVLVCLLIKVNTLLNFSLSLLIEKLQVQYKKLSFLILVRMILETKKLTLIYNMYYYQLILGPHSSFANCSNNVLYSKWTKFRIMCHFLLSFVQFPLAETFPQVFFDIRTLTCLKTTHQLQYAGLLQDVSQFELSNVSS